MSHTRVCGDDLLALFGLGPRACEDCGTIFSVPPYMECAKLSRCFECGAKRFAEWITTDEGKKAAAMMREGWTETNAKMIHSESKS